MWTLKTDIHFEAASAGGDADCCSDIMFGWSSISTVFDPSGGVTNEQKKQKYHMTVSANAAISLMGFDPFWTSENFHATCDTCLEWKKLVNEREEERESPSHVSHLACLVPKSHFPLRNCWLHYLPKDSLSMACELSLLWELPLWWHEEGPLKMEERLHSFSLDSEWFCCFSFTFTLFTWRKGIDNWFLKNRMLKFCTHLWNHPTSCKNQESSPGTVIDHLNEFVGSGIYKPDITALHLECMCIMLVLWEKAHEIVYVLWE